MGRLTFGMMTSLDGYINDHNGNFDWSHVSEDVHRFTEQQQAREGTAIYGRRMFETMVVWDTLAEDQTISQLERDFAVIWQQTDKVVVSRTLDAVSAKRTRLVRELSADDIRKLKAEFEKDISVSGPTLAAAFTRSANVGFKLPMHFKLPMRKLPMRQEPGDAPATHRQEQQAPELRALRLPGGLLHAVPRYRCDNPRDDASHSYDSMIP